MSPRPALGDVAELVRLPAVLTVPGDVLLGAAAAGWPGGRGAALGIGSGSALQYLAGMALNDYADRDVDAVERPHRPVPSGRVTPRFALALAASLTAAGIAAASLAGGAPARRRALALAGAVWAYDLVLKQSPAGPAAMAAARFTDVLAGSGARTRAALPAALVVGAHTLAVTVVSRSEARGGSARIGEGALAATGAVSAAAAAFAAGRGGGSVRLVAAGALLGTYAASLAGAAGTAAREPTAANVQRVVGTGVLGLLPLQASMLVASGGAAAGLAVAGAWPLARRLSRKKAVT
ncbi:MAG TPA: UbiA family prenyltransferase [Gaiellaceae bacterium]|nr:UbiA family prenyltransferase [Gaiellaceae bacterium]